ncbi:MAG: hypothetical protein RJQ10_15465, partial [Haliea sp.]|uniref:M20/M25/M40 family metallo-hydrolase n=1 Tax=Haliea sp. TaxID=1932666 RepID=UPI0032EBCABD
WYQASKAGAFVGLLGGVLVWGYTLLLPSFEGGSVIPASLFQEGPWGIADLRPQALFGTEGVDPLVHSLVWSLGINVALFVLVSLVRDQKPLERLQATVTGIAEANGASASLAVTGSTPVTGNHPQLLQAMMPTLVRAAGEDRVFEGNLITGAEDFSYYQEKIPGLFLMLGVGDPAVPREQRPSNHSPLFTVQEDVLIVGVRTLVGFALDYPGGGRF